MTAFPDHHEPSGTHGTARVRRSMAVALITVVLCSLSVSFAAIAITGHRSATAATDDIMERLGARTAEQVATHLGRSVETLELTDLLIGSGAVEERDDELDRMLAARLTTAPYLTGIFVGYPDGAFRFVRRVDDDLVLKRIDVAPRTVTEAIVDDRLRPGPAERLDDSYDPVVRPWYTAAVGADEAIWTDPYVFFSSGEPGVTAATALRDSEGGLVAVLGVDVSLGDLGRFLDDLASDGKAEAFLVAGDVVVAAPTGYDITQATEDGRLALSSVDDLDAGLDADLVARAATQPVATDTAARTSSVQLADPTLPGWTVVVRADDLGFVDVVRSQSRLALITTSVAAVMLLVLIGLFVGRLRRPIDELNRRARLDPLTKLPNRRALIEDGSTALERAVRNGRDLVVAVLDIDDFKTINDAHGHATGDGALRRLAEGLRLSMRPGDIAGRLGGDEFVVLVPDVDRQVAHVVLERVRDVTEAELKSAPATAEATITIGATALDGRDIDLRSLIAEADDQLLTAKRDRKGVIAWSPEPGTEPSAEPGTEPSAEAGHDAATEAAIGAGSAVTG